MIVGQSDREYAKTSSFPYIALQMRKEQATVFCKRCSIEERKAAVLIYKKKIILVVLLRLFSPSWLRPMLTAI